MVSKTKTNVVRKCPFCGGYVEDEPGKDINFIVHLGTPTAKHAHEQIWADYVAAMHHV